MENIYKFIGNSVDGIKDKHWRGSREISDYICGHSSQTRLCLSLIIFIGRQFLMKVQKLKIFCPALKVKTTTKVSVKKRYLRIANISKVATRV